MPPTAPMSNSSIQNVNPKDVDILLAKELNAMTMQEREAMYEEIHGVEQLIEETPDFLEEKLEAMWEALEAIDDKPLAYQLAIDQNKAYIHSPELGLMMLRSVYFHPSQAAEKLLKYLEAKCDLFGPGSLCRSLCIEDDLSKDDVQFFKSGAFQYLPSRDSNGRAVFLDTHLMVPEGKQYKEHDNVIKTLAYIHLAAFEDVETQKRGVVGVMYYMGKFVVASRELNKRCGKMMAWLPIRAMGFHMCYHDPRFRALSALTTWLMDGNLRRRLRTHVGSHAEVQYKLMSFGVPVGVLPVTYQGEIKHLAHCKWLRRRQAKERQLLQLKQERSKDDDGDEKLGYTSTTSSAGVDLPSRGDVLLQRGRVFQENPGNRNMHLMIARCVDHYDQDSSVKEKATFSVNIVDDILARGGRFLERDADGWWIVVTKAEAIKRVAKSIRYARANSKSHRSSKEIGSSSKSSNSTDNSGHVSKRQKLIGDLPKNFLGEAEPTPIRYAPCLPNFCGKQPSSDDTPTQFYDL